MWDKLIQIWQARDIRNRIIFVLLLLVVFRIAAHIPLPGIDASQLKNLIDQNQIFGLLNLFSGGGLENFSIVMLGVGPYITASIILQLLMMIVPKLEEMSKEGEAGQQKINQYTRLLTVPLGIIQAYAFVMLIQNQQQGNLMVQFGPLQLVTALIAATAGTIFLMWLGELITEKKVGNGISLMIFAGIVSTLPTAIRQTAALYDATQIINIFIFLAIALITIIAIVFITEGQRNIPVSYARQVQGSRSMGGVNTHLPLRVNQAGVIPIIFAVSIVLFPPMVAGFFRYSHTPWVAQTADYIVNLFNNNLLFYGIFYFLMVFVFTYFYTAVVFKPEQIAENLQKQGGFIPGIRPGKHTEEYLRFTMNRIVLVGALFLGLIAVLPLTVQFFTNVQTLVVGGTSLLIVVSVVIESVKQIESQLVMRDYEVF